MNLRNLAIYGVIIVVLIALYSVLNPSAKTGGGAGEIRPLGWVSRELRGAERGVDLAVIGSVGVGVWCDVGWLADDRAA